MFLKVSRFVLLLSIFITCFGCERFERSVTFWDKVRPTGDNPFGSLSTDERTGFTVITYNNKIWVMGGVIDFNNEYKHDVWCSENGREWTLVTSSAEWEPRSGLETVIYDGKMWIFGGGDFSRGITFMDAWWTTDGKSWFEATSSSHCFGQYIVYDDKLWGFDGDDVWWSKDGIEWLQVTSSAPFSSGCVVVFDDKMWHVGDYTMESHEDNGWYSFDHIYSGSAWWSTDGFNWTKVSSGSPWDGREAYTCIVYDGRIWCMGGISSEGIECYNDVWWTHDGITWVLASHARWERRAGIKSIVYDNKIWIFGGYKKVKDHKYINQTTYSYINFNEIWYCSY